MSSHHRGQQSLDWFLVCGYEATLGLVEAENDKDGKTYEHDEAGRACDVKHHLIARSSTSADLY